MTSEQNPYSAPDRLAPKSSRTRAGALVLLMAATALLTGGCVMTAAPCTAAATAPHQFMSVAALPAMLGMRAERISAWSASLTDSTNTLLVLSRPQYQVLLNGRRMDGGADVCRADGRLMIRRTLATKLGKALSANRAAAAATLLAETTVAAVEPSSQRVSATVAIDAGHGGSDPGATAGAGPDEKILALDIARRVSARLASKGVRVVMTRNSDTFVELNDRAAIANEVGADLFVSIHLDTNPSSELVGHTIYIARQASSGSMRLGEAVDRRLKGLTPGRRGLRRQDFRVLVRTRMPAILVETGFMSNPADRARLNTGDYRQRLADTIAAGILDYAAAR